MVKRLGSDYDSPKHISSNSIYYRPKDFSTCPMFYFLNGIQKNPCSKMSCQTLNVIPLSINRNDLLTAIKKLKVLGSGFALIPVGQSYLVQSVPGELTMDHTTVLQQAQVSHVMSNCLYIYHTTGSGKSHHVYTSIIQQSYHRLR